MNRYAELSNRVAESMIAGISAPFDLGAKYSSWNARAFGNELPNVPLKWSTLRGVGGRVRGRISRPSGTRPSILEKFIPQRQDIAVTVLEISNFLKLNEEVFDQILLHEMCHVYVMGILGLNEGSGGHGRNFMEKLAEVRSRSGIDVPAVELITTGMEVSEEIPAKDVGVVIATRGSRTLLQVFNMSAFGQVLNRWWDKLDGNPYFGSVTALTSEDRALLKYPAQRKESSSWYPIESNLAAELVRNGRVLREASQLQTGADRAASVWR